MGRLVEHRLAAFLVARDAQDPQVAHAVAPLGAFLRSAAQAWFPADALRHSPRQRVTERALFRTVNEQGNAHPMIMPWPGQFHTCRRASNEAGGGRYGHPRILRRMWRLWRSRRSWPLIGGAQFDAGCRSEGCQLAYYHTGPSCQLPMPCRTRPMSAPVLTRCSQHEAGTFCRKASRNTIRNAIKWGGGGVQGLCATGGGACAAGLDHHLDRGCCQQCIYRRLGPHAAAKGQAPSCLDRASARPQSYAVAARAGGKRPGRKRCQCRGRAARLCRPVQAGPGRLHRSRSTASLARGIRPGPAPIRLRNAGRCTRLALRCVLA
jgi:hypothetical protein